MPTRTDDSQYFGGPVTFGGEVSLPVTCVGDANVSGSSPITAAKLQHQYVERLAQAHGSSATAERRVAHIAQGAGTLLAVKVTPVVAAVGDSTVTIDVKKNGTTMLSSTVVITSSMAAFSVTVGTVAGGGTYVAGDVIEIVQTVSAGTGTLPQGVCTELVLREAAA